jgi:hypothetical protein
VFLKLKSKLIKFFIIFLIFIGILFLLIVVVVSSHYIPQILERLEISTNSKNTGTYFANKDFVFSFSINKNCSVDTDTLNNLLRKHWRGKIVCKNSKDYLNVSIEENLPVDTEKYSSFERIYGGGMKSNYFLLFVKHPKNEKVFKISGRNADTTFGQDILNTILEIH